MSLSSLLHGLTKRFKPHVQASVSTTPKGQPMAPNNAQEFLLLRFLRSEIIPDPLTGTLRRVEYRKDDQSGLTFKRVSKIVGAPS